VPFGEELLIAAETGFAGRKELLIDLGMIEAGHWSAIEAERPRGHDHVRALQAGIPHRRRFHHLRVALEKLRYPGVLGEQLRQLLVELHVGGDDHGNGSGHRLLNIEWGQRRAEPFLGIL
jgi:hypothetical protein